MPTKIIVDLTTGQITEVELEGAELDAYNASLASPQVETHPVTQNPEGA